MTDPEKDRGGTPPARSVDRQGDVAPPDREIRTDDPITIRRTERVRRREAWVGWTSVIANILVPLGIGAAVYGIIEKTWSDRRDAADRQIELFFSDTMTSAQTTLFSLWTQLDLTVLRSPQSRDFIDAFVERTIEARPDAREDVMAAIVIIASYFDRVQACVETGRCDEDAVIDQLGQYGRDFHCIYAGQIADIRDSTLVFSLGQGLEEFTTRAGGCSGGG